MDTAAFTKARARQQSPLRRARSLTDGQSAPGPVDQLAARLALAPDEHRATTGMLVQGETKFITWELPASLKRVEIIQITDMQWGGYLLQPKTHH